MSDSDLADFWSPTLDVTTRDDGTIIIQQDGKLPVFMPTLADYLDKWADATPDQIWIARRDGGRDWSTITYGDARSAARKIGASLLAMGLGPNRPLLILSGNSLEHALLGAACFYVGIPYAPVSPAYSLVSKDHKKLKDIAALLKPGAIFADDGTAFASAIASIAQADSQIINLTAPIPQAVRFEALLEGEESGAAAARASVSADTVVKYLFTSGSTGSPKAVINTNGMICSCQAMIRDCYRFLEKSPPVVLDWGPWNHTASGNKVSYLVMTNGGTYYIDDGRPVPGKFDETLRNLGEISCTWYFNVPVGWDMLVDRFETDAALAQTFFKDLKMMFYAGAGMAQHTWDRLRAVAHKVTGHDVLLATGLGATETAPSVLFCTEAQDRAGNVGVPNRGLSLKLVPTGGKLEMRVRGPSVTPGYYGDPEKTAEVFDEEGYYCMGDALRPADADDFSKGFFFDGRIAENFKLSTGTWVAVGSVRAALVDAMGGLVRDAVIIGENKPELGALLVLSEAAKAMDPQECRAALETKLRQASLSATGSANRVKHARAIDREPSFDKGEVTEKGSLNQQAMRSNHAKLIEAIYADQEEAISV